MPHFTVTMVWVECSNCGVSFGLTEEFQSRRRRDRKSFYCPNGHSQWYPGKSEKQLLQEEKDRVARLQAEIDQKAEALRDAYDGLPGDLVVARCDAARFSIRRQTAWWNGYRDAEGGGKSEEDCSYPAAFGWKGAWLRGFRLRRKQMGIVE